MKEINYLVRENNTQKVYLTEDTLDVTDILRQNYDYILNAINEEEFILKASSCSLFKELVFDEKVVGFCSYDFSREFITAALNNIYVLPEFRGNGLFYDELVKTMQEHNKPSIIEPTRLVVELLLKYGFAEMISDNIAASSIEFIIPGENVISNGSHTAAEELSTHFYDMKLCASIHFLDVENSIIAYSHPLNYDIIHYDCLDFRNSIDDDYFENIRDFFVSNDVEIMNTMVDLEEKIQIRSYTLEEIVGEGDELSPYIESLIDDGHVTHNKALKIKQQIIEEYEAGMILNESLLIRLAYLFEEKTEPTIKSHSDVCPYCNMPTDSHDRFCHFCGINLDYNPQDMFENLLGYLNDSDEKTQEDIRFVAYKFLKLICQGIEFEYCVFTIENAYAVEWSRLDSYLKSNGYFTNEKITQKGYEFLDAHPLTAYEKYCLNMVDYTDFEKYFYDNKNLKEKEIVLGYLRQFDDEFQDIIDEIKDN